VIHPQVHWQRTRLLRSACWSSSLTETETENNGDLAGWRASLLEGEITVHHQNKGLWSLPLAVHHCLTLDVLLITNIIGRFLLPTEHHWLGIREAAITKLWPWNWGWRWSPQDKNSSRWSQFITWLRLRVLLPTD
jgi:hypothetical protein